MLKKFFSKENGEKIDKKLDVAMDWFGRLIMPIVLLTLFGAVLFVCLGTLGIGVLASSSQPKIENRQCNTVIIGGFPYQVCTYETRQPVDKP